MRGVHREGTAGDTIASISTNARANCASSAPMGTIIEAHRDQSWAVPRGPRRPRASAGSLAIRAHWLAASSDPRASTACAGELGALSNLTWRMSSGRPRPAIASCTRALVATQTAHATPTRQDGPTRSAISAASSSCSAASISSATLLSLHRWPCPWDDGERGTHCFSRSDPFRTRPRAHDALTVLSSFRRYVAKT